MLPVGCSPPVGVSLKESAVIGLGKSFAFHHHILDDGSKYVRFYNGNPSCHAILGVSEIGVFQV